MDERDRHASFATAEATRAIAPSAHIAGGGYVRCAGPGQIKFPPELPDLFNRVVRLQVAAGLAIPFIFFDETDPGSLGHRFGADENKQGIGCACLHRSIVSIPDEERFRFIGAGCFSYLYACDLY